MYSFIKMFRAVIVVLILATTTILIEACPSIITRSTWKARSPKRKTYIGGNLPYVVIHTTGGPQCFTEQSCANIVKSIQDYHMNEENNAHDIDYNFLVDPLGNVYEGRGWEYKGNHESAFNSNSIGIAIIGSYINTTPNAKTIEAVKDLIDCGVRFQRLKFNYKLFGHRQVKETDCPGIRLYEIIKNWPHWTSMPQLNQVDYMA